MRHKCPTLLLAMAILSLTVEIAKSEVQSYQFPEEAPCADDFTLEADDQNVFVYDSDVAAVATFGMQGETVVRIDIRKPFKDFIIRPISANVRAKRDDQTIQLTLSEPLHLSLELDGDITRPLYLFANPLEQPPEQDKNVRYFAPGKIYHAGCIELSNNETLYIAGGAIVQGYVRAEDAERIRILGPGILDASHRRNKKLTSVLLRNCCDVEIRDTLIMDSYGWTVHLSQCLDAKISNMKQGGWRANSDGIDIEASSDVHVTGSFLRNADDCVAIKSKPKGDGQGLVTENVLIEKTVFWNSLPGNAMEIGFELRADAIRNITFRDCDIIRVERGAAFSIHNGDYALVENVLFEDIRVEDVRGDFADMYIGLSIYSGDCPDPYRRSDPKRKRIAAELQDPVSGDNVAQWLLPKDKSGYAARRGNIRDVVFRDIQFYLDEEESLPPSLFVGYDEEHAIENITFDGIHVNGRRLSQWPEGAVTTRHAKNIPFLP